MIVTITYIRLWNGFKVIELIKHGNRIKKQLWQQNCRGYKQFGFWRHVYTMTMWDNEEDMKFFARTGEHKESMKSTAHLGKQVRSYTFEADKFPGWLTAFKLVRNGKVINFPKPKRKKAPIKAVV